MAEEIRRQLIAIKKMHMKNKKNNPKDDVLDALKSSKEKAKKVK